MKCDFDRQLLTTLMDQLEGLSQHRACPVVGIAGPPGVGKSTLSAALAAELYSQSELCAVVLSLDDFYFSKAVLQQRAELLHPLFATRGLPGTHDIDLLLNLLRAILSNNHSDMPVPRFSKQLNDRLPLSEWGLLPDKIDLVLLEGWCLGASVQSDQQLQMPVNQFERQFDADASWRHQVNRFLATDYQALFSLIDQYILITVDGFSDVFHLREQQEQDLLSRTGMRQMNASEVEQFVSYFERMVCQMLFQFEQKDTIYLHCDSNRHYTYLTEV